MYPYSHIVRLVLWYAVLSAAWIAVTDLGVELLVDDSDLLTRWQTAKGWAFVLFSSALLGILLWRERRLRTRSERDARQARLHFEQIFRNNAAAQSITTVTDGRFVEANVTFEEMFGHARSEILGRTALNIGLWDDPEDRRNAVEGLLRGETIHAQQSTFHHRSGAAVETVWSADLIDLDGTPHILSAMIDVTGRREIEHKIEELNQELLQQNLALSEAYARTIEGWAHALGFKDEETQAHSRRVTELTERLARHLGLAEDQLEHVRRGALLHDIGKMCVPDKILLKPGALTAEERAVMQQHTVQAKEMLERIAFLEPALAIPYCHHEKWDGTGYPRGLAGDDIPLEARIFAVVDVFDALSSERPYRSAWNREAVEAYLWDERGKHFDPVVVDGFLELIGAEPPARLGPAEN